MNQSTPIFAAMLRRLGAEFRLKVALLAVMPAAFLACYIPLQHMNPFPRHHVPILGPDRWVPFDPRWVYVYESLWLLLPITPFLSADRGQLYRYARGALLLCAGCFLIFLLLPVAAPRPAVIPDHPVYRLLVQYDGLINSMPSLHVALAVYSVLYGWEILRRVLSPAARLGYAGVAIIWTFLIAYSTLATRQHWTIDLPPGALSGLAAHAWVWRDTLLNRESRLSPISHPRTGVLRR